MIRRSRGTTVTTSVTNAAVRVGFYDVEAESGLPRGLFESMLGDIEGQVAQALRRIDEQPWPPNDDDRLTLALFMALQMVRTPEHRFMFEEMADVQLKSQLAGLSREQVRVWLAEEGFEATGQAVDEQLRVLREDLGDYRMTTGQGFMWGMLLTDVAPRLAAVMVEGFDWHLMASDRRLLATSDHPLLLWTDHPNRFMGVGIGTADALVLPLDSRKLLLLTKDRMGVSTEIPLARFMAKGTNGYLLGHSYEWVFHDPRISPFEPDDLAPHRRAAFTINGKEVREPGDTWKVFSDVFYKTQDAYFGDSAEEE